MLYEVFIPALSEDAKNVTLKVDAESWIAALRSGLATIGEQGDIVENVMCDIQGDGQIHVTDPKSQRIFKIRELAEGDVTERDLSAQGQRAATVPDKSDSPDWKDLAGGHIQTEGSVEHDPDSRVLEVREEQATEQSVADARASVQDSEDLLSEVFEESSKIYDFGEDMQGAVEFVMDLCMEKVGVEAGSILFANINENDLYFASARGPKASEIMGYRVPMGKGIVGFVAKEGQGLAISNASRSPLFFKQISEAIGYPARSIACAPIEHDGRCYGAIELLNRKGSDQFSPGELEMIKYMGARLAEHVSQVIMANA